MTWTTQDFRKRVGTPEFGQSLGEFRVAAR